MVLLGEIRVSQRQTFLRERWNKGDISGLMRDAELFDSADTDLLSLDCPAVAMRLEDVMKAKSPQVLVWHCQLCQQETNIFILM